MAEYYAVLKKAVSGMDGAASDARRAVYDKARNALIGQLKAIDPPLSTSEISRQRLELEEAIRRVERESAAETQSPRGRGVESVREAVGEAGGPSPQDVFRRAIQDAESRASVPARAENYVDNRSMRDRIERNPPADAYQGQEPRGRRPQPQLAPDYDDDWQAPPREAAVPPPPAEPYVDRRDRPPQQRQPGRKERGGRAAYRDEEAGGGRPQRASRRSRLPAIILTVLILALLVGLAALGWSQRDLIASFIGEQDGPAPTAEVLPPETDEPAPLTPEPAESTKDADRLGGADGEAPAVRTVDEPPADQARLEPSETQQLPAAGGATEKATLYEEPLGGESASAGQVLAVPGTVSWQLVQGTDGPEVVGNVSLPDRMAIKLTIRKNSDSALPASHLIEVVVNPFKGFDSRGIRTVPRLVMKGSEDGRGTALVGAAAKVADGLFWIALSSAPEDIRNNIKTLADNGWVDVPLVYGNGQRAILTMPKGSEGENAFQTAMQAWGQTVQQ